MSGFRPFFAMSSFSYGGVALVALLEHNAQ